MQLYRSRNFTTSNCNFYIENEQFCKICDFTAKCRDYTIKSLILTTKWKFWLQQKVMSPTSSAHMWKRTLAGNTLPYSQRSALILRRRSYLEKQPQTVKRGAGSRDCRCGWSCDCWRLQVGDRAALVPEQAAVTQFDGRNELRAPVSLRLVPEMSQLLFLTNI